MNTLLSPERSNGQVRASMLQGRMDCALDILSFLKAEEVFDE